MSLKKIKYHFIWILIISGCVTCLETPAEPLNFTEIATTAGLTCEEHEVSTEDGYLLWMFRLPGDPSRPVMLLSGAYGTADDYIIRENTSLPYVLNEAGYDVWVGNVRGCRYGRRHVSLDPDKDDRFWDFSFHEYAIYDTPAMIDYVLNKTNQKQLSTIGWSLGTTSFYILGAERPEYIDKVKIQISLAPIAYLHHSPAFLALTWPGTIANIGFILVDKQQIFGKYSKETAFVRKSCSNPTTAFYICLQFSFLTFGFDPDEIEQDFAPTIFAHFPSTISRKTLGHNLQVLRTRRFAKYDYGLIENLRRYGSMLPKEYNLKNNNMSIIMISGKNDLTSTLADVELLKPKLGNVVKHIILEPEKFNHLDFLHGKTTHDVLHKPIILDILSKYN